MIKKSFPFFLPILKAYSFNYHYQDQDPSVSGMRAEHTTVR